MRRSVLGSLIAFLLIAALFASRSALRSRAPEIHELSGLTMGTTYSVMIDAGDLTPARSATVRDTIEARLETVNRLMSTYDSASELSRFNRHESVMPFRASPPTLEVFEIARRVSQRSGGAFDVTVGPLVDAWGFGPSERRSTPPDDRELQRLQERVGYERIIIDMEAGTLAKTHPGTVADLSAVAKGYGVDLVAEALDALGFTAFMVEVGGEIRARGRKADGSPWRAGVELPGAEVRAVYYAVDLVDMAVATSGDYRNYYEVDGVRYAHILDPRTGRPARHAGASVSVVHERAAVADAWATALSVLGPEEGRQLAEREGLAAYFLTRVGEGLEARVTSAFERLTGR
jgi:thiamine biosynthesis lipoprotein